MFCDGGSFPLVAFMSKPAIRGNLTIFNADIAATHAQGLTYILGYVVTVFPLLSCDMLTLCPLAAERRIASHVMARLA